MPENLASSLDGSGLRVAVVTSRFNEVVTRELCAGAVQSLIANNVAPDDILNASVAGAWELPLAARSIIDERAVDAVVALGCVIRGETAHFDFVAGQAAAGLMRVSLDTGVPVAFGVLTTETLEQALERVGARSDKHTGGTPVPPKQAFERDNAHDNKGADAAQAAVEMATLRRALRA